MSLAASSSPSALRHLPELSISSLCPTAISFVVLSDKILVSNLALVPTCLALIVYAYTEVTFGDKYKDFKDAQASPEDQNGKGSQERKSPRREQIRSKQPREVVDRVRPGPEHWQGHQGVKLPGG
ncbi:hypothetical protein V8E52_007749 [Russula decolorans]